MNKNTLFLLAFAVPLLTMGVGCSKKISSIPTTPVTTTTDVSCVVEGQSPIDGNQCCAGLEVVAVDNAYGVCGKPGTGYKPKACMDEGETPFVDTPKCCANLEPVLQGGKYICTDLSAITAMKYTNNTYGFSLDFPGTWKGYTAKNRTLDWGVGGTSDSIDFGFLAQDALFNVSVHTKSQWQKIKSGEGPIPTYLGENSQYVFGYTLAQYSANDAMAARINEIKDIIKTFKVVPLPTTTITYYLLHLPKSATLTTFCSGNTMDSAGYKVALTQKITRTEPGNMTVEQKIKTTLGLAADDQRFNQIYTRTDSTTFENGVVTMHSASGWAGASIFYCAWTPFVEKNLEQFAEVKEIKWQAGQ